MHTHLTPMATLPPSGHSPASRPASLPPPGHSPAAKPAALRLPSLLDLCSSPDKLPAARGLHARLLSTGLIPADDFVHTRLQLAYSRCGALADSRRLFDEMPRPSIFAWNALISAHVSSSLHSDALRLFLLLRCRSHPLPDACTFSSALTAAAALPDPPLGRAIHGLAVRSGAVAALFVANALLAFYSKCGHPIDARKVFDALPDNNTDIVSWNSMINACTVAGQFPEALDLFREMQRAALPMSSYTIVSVLQACSQLSMLNPAREIHAATLKTRRELGLFESNALLVIYARCGRMDNAKLIFNQIPHRDIVSWNSILSGYLQNERYEEALETFREMRGSGLPPDRISFLSTASALGRMGNLAAGKELHCYALRCGFDLDVLVGSTLMDMYVKCCCIDYAMRVFRRMPSKDIISWTTALAGYAQKGCYLEAVDMFRELQSQGMKVDALMMGSILMSCTNLRHLKEIHGYATRHSLLDRMLRNSLVDLYGEFRDVGYAVRVFEGTGDNDVVSWTSLLNSYLQNGFLNEAVQVFRDMGTAADVAYDVVALNSVLALASELSSLKMGKEIHGLLLRKELDMDESIRVNLVDMYARCGSLANCFKIVDAVVEKDLLLWTAVVNACGMHGCGREAVQRFRSLLDTGILPDHVAFLSVLYACVHSGLVEEGKGFLDVMRNEYKLEPWPEHHTCIVDLLGRSGRIDEAYEFIRTMPTKPTAAAWCALLGACRVHSNNEIGEVAARALLELEPQNPGNYVLISNAFAAASKWNEVEEVRKKMKEMGLRKDPGCSWIELGSKVHSFIARDSSHPESERINAKLDEIKETLKREVGYVGDTSFVLHNVDEDEKLKLLYGHSEKLAIAFGLISTPERAPIRITKNLRICGDCHEFTKHVSRLFSRELILRDANRFHHFKDGTCSCGDFW